jgi:hypothetical protein
MSFLRVHKCRQTHHDFYDELNSLTLNIVVKIHSLFLWLQQSHNSEKRSALKYKNMTRKNRKKWNEHKKRMKFFEENLHTFHSS